MDGNQGNYFTSNVNDSASQSCLDYNRLSIVSLNVASNSVIVGGLLDILRSSKPHIVFLQEITLTTSQLCHLVVRYLFALCSYFPIIGSIRVL